VSGKNTNRKQSYDDDEIEHGHAGGLGAVLLVAAHDAVVWGGVSLSAKIVGWLAWIGGGALAFAFYHVIRAFGVYHVVWHIRGRNHGGSSRSSGHMDGRGEVERGPHDGFLVNLGHGFVEITILKIDVPPRFRLFLYDKHKQPRSVPRNATVKIETMRPDETRQMFDFYAKGEYLESTIDIPEPHEFKAIVHVSHGNHIHAPHEVHFSDHDQAHHAEGSRHGTRSLGGWENDAARLRSEKPRRSARSQEESTGRFCPKATVETLRPASF
jgi:hypothetical protein